MNKLVTKKPFSPLPKPASKVSVVEKPQPIQEKKPIEKPIEELPKVIKSFKVQEANNKFEVTLTKMANRSFQIKILFNGNEIRPATYTGMSPAMNYWNLLSGSKK